MSFRKVAVLGLGKVGHLAAELLVESGFEVTGVDARKVDAPFPTRSVDLQDQAAIADLLKGRRRSCPACPSI
jgi:UDP-N-acetylmuramoylalanine-D-glutamate ligase